MRFRPARIEGVLHVEAEPICDERGFFARLSCPGEFKAAGVDFEPRQTSLSRNSARSTLRGMHFTTVPEAKFVRCVRGRIFDVVVDIRAGSPTIRQWVGFELDATRADALYIAPGLAHGFLTLEPETDVLYQIDRIYSAGHDAGYRWDDPAFAITWPAVPAVVHPRDLSYSLWTPC